MGISISWIALKGAEKDAVAAALAVQDTGVIDEIREEGLSWAEFPAGWLVIYSNDHGFASHERLERLSVDGISALGCRVEDHVMVSDVRCYKDGAEIWSVEHDCERGLYDLTVKGDPPAQLTAVRERLIAQQDEAGGEDADVDYLFDGPVDLAEVLCGFRHDLDDSSAAAPVFTVLDPVFPLSARRSESRGGGILALLRGLFQKN